MAARLILIGIGALYSIYCIAVVVLTFLGLNFAIYHLTNFFLVGFAAIYGVLTPFGISGILGGYNRKKSLLRSFIIQYWIATSIFVGISVANIFFAQKLRNDTIRKCQSERFFQNSDNLSSCSAKVSSAQKATLLFAIIQGSVLVFFGVFVIVFGIRECKDIAIEEEANSLLAKASLKESNDKIASPSSDRLSPSTSLHRNNSNNSNTSSNDAYVDSNNINNFVPQRYNQGYVYPTGEAPMSAPYTDVRRQQNNPARIPSNRIPGSDISRYQPTVNNVSLDRNPTVTRQATNGDNNYSQRAYPNDAYTDISIPPRRTQYANLDRSLSAKNYTDSNRIPPQYSSQSTPMPTIITRNGQNNKWKQNDDDYNNYNNNYNNDYTFKYV